MTTYIHPIDALTAMLWRSGVLKGDPLPGGSKLLTLDAVEFVRNVISAMVVLGLPLKGKALNGDLTVTDAEALARKHKLYEGPLAIPKPGEPIKGIYNALVPNEHRLVTGVLYLAVKPKRPRGRPPDKVMTPEEKQARRDALVAGWISQGITSTLLATLKRHHLMMLASEFGIHDPAYRGGTNEDLRKKILQRARKKA